jgi:hypothetical protein
LSEGLAVEVRENADGRSRPLALTKLGKNLLSAAEPECLAAEVEATTLLGKNEMMTVIGVGKRLAYTTEVKSSPQ